MGVYSSCIFQIQILVGEKMKYERLESLFVANGIIALFAILIITLVCSGCMSGKQRAEMMKHYYAQKREMKTVKMSGITEIKGDDITIETAMPLNELGLPKSDLEVFMAGLTKIAPFAAMWGVMASTPSAPEPTIVTQPEPVIVQPSYAP